MGTSNSAKGVPGSRFELLVRIGSGGMATVHLGRRRDAGLAQLVAIKRLHPHLGNDRSARQAMLGEAAIASRIHHANVVAVREVEQIGPEILLVMDYVEGASLKQLLSGGAGLARGVAVRVILEAAAGLTAAHELHDDYGRPVGAVHRDVTPENLLVGIDGVTRITDFGVAKCTAFENMTQAGILKGKFGYMAPEYLMGLAIDARADVFALGVVAWELLAQKPLFRAGTASATMQRVARMPTPRLSTVAAGVDPAFDAVMEKALTKHPAKRFESVAEFAEAFATAAWNGGAASQAEVGAMVRTLASESLAQVRAELGAQLARGTEPRLPRPERSAPPPLPQGRAGGGQNETVASYPR